MESLKEKTAKGLFWGGMNNGVQQLLGLAFGIILGRLLDPSDYGMTAMLAVFSVIANELQASGFKTGLINMKAPTHDDYNALPPAKTDSPEPLRVPGLCVLQLRNGTVGLSDEADADQADCPMRYDSHTLVESRQCVPGLAGFRLLGARHTVSDVHRPSTPCCSGTSVLGAPRSPSPSSLSANCSRSAYES